MQHTHQNFCTHTGTVSVLRFDQCTVFAGSRRDAEPCFPHAAFVLSCMGREGIPTGYEPPFTAIEWPNFRTPNVSRYFWQLLYERLQSVHGKTVIFCRGGHGRTGTALAILAHLSGACGSDDPVEWVRARYCQEAVETPTQLNYLNNLGVLTQAKPRRK